MKCLLLSAVIALSLTSCSISTTVALFDKDGKHMGILPKKDGRIYYSERVSIPGATKAQLHHYIRQWLALDHSPITPREIVSDSNQTEDFIISCTYAAPKIRSKDDDTFTPPATAYTIVIDHLNAGYRLHIGNFQSTSSILGRKGIVTSGQRLEYYNVGPKSNHTAYLTKLNEEITRQVTSLHNYLSEQVIQ